MFGKHCHYCLLHITNRIAPTKQAEFLHRIGTTFSAREPGSLIAKDTQEVQQPEIDSLDKQLSNLKISIDFCVLSKRLFIIAADS